jgi:transcription termination/antitermination protein NusG
MPEPDEPTGFKMADEPPVASDAEWEVGDQLRVAVGLMEGLTGRVIGIRPGAGRLVLRVVIFGRETPIELRYDEVMAAGR